MSPPPEQEEPEGEAGAQMARAVRDRETRKLRARRETRRGIWFGLGMFGVVGWSVAIPTVVGIALGIWLDRVRPARHSWTLTLLVLGVAAGCLNAWVWLSRERRSIERRDEGQGRE